MTAAGDPNAAVPDRVSVAEHGDVALVRMQADRTGNALDPVLCGELVDVLDQVLDSAARAVVLTGAGRFFSTGGDLAELEAWSSWEPLERRDWLESGPHRISRALLDYPLPTVAAINGAAYGAGLDLALACDLRVACASARLCEAYVNVGVIPGDGGAWLLPRLIGMGPAMDLLLTGRVVGAEEALALGLVNRLADDDATTDEAVELARRVGSQPGRAARLIRQAVHASATQRFDEHLEYAGFLMATVAGSTAHRDAVRQLRISRSERSSAT